MENQVAIICDPKNTRGLDFKLSDALKNSQAYNPSKGIDLLLHAPTLNPRDFIQCAGRVGRYNESCRRFMIKSITPFKNEDGYKAL